ncbi:MAG: alpha-L-fucosidase [Phycisphaerae bacterium]|nr:alpha-L-fucosidase [Phycisphaerae bacterium]
MKRAIRLSVVAVCVGSVTVSAVERYEPTWASLDSRPVPGWFEDSKFGIFIHWGVYSVPAWGPKGKYAEWYWKHMQDKDGPTWKFHVAQYGERFQYQDFAPRFRAELFNPTQWAELFARSGARYVVLTSKHHEGFCLWPSPDSWNWNSVDIGPHRDLCGELTEAVKATGLKMGFYYSLYEWFHPLYLNEPQRYVAEHMMPQIKDLVERYKPSLLWTDGEWEHPEELWRSREILAWLFNESSVRDEVAINDRWGKETRSRHGGFFTTEYSKHHPGDAIGAEHPWEECRGIGASFGFSRNEDAEDYASTRSLVHLLVDTVSRGGNLLLDIGPTADGRIPPIMQERLLGIGAWLKVNGEAIYGTRAWAKAPTSEHVRFTAKGQVIYAIALDWPGAEFVLEIPDAAGDVRATLLGYEGPLASRVDAGKLHVAVPVLAPNALPCEHAYVFKLEGLE